MVIDIFSKYGWIIPLKSKRGIEVAHAFNKIFKHRKCNKLWVDKGLEFYNKHVKALGIQLYSTENEEKSYEMVDQYNNTKHSSIKMTPAEASDKKNENKVWMNLNSKVISNSIKPKFSIGDKVRITKKKATFEKGYTPRWSKEVFTISQIQYTDPPTYKITDYNNEEIQEYKLKTDRLEELRDNKGYFENEISDLRDVRNRRYGEEKIHKLDLDIIKLEIRLKKEEEKILDLMNRLEELEIELKLEKLKTDILIGDKILKEEMIKCRMEDKFGLMSYLILDNKVLECEKYDKELKKLTCLETDKKRIDALKFKLQFEDEVLEDLKERFNSRSELVIDKERMNKLVNYFGFYGYNKIELYDKEIKELKEFKKIKEKLDLIKLDLVFDKERMNEEERIERIERNIKELEELNKYILKMIIEKLEVSILREIEMLEELDERIEAIRLDDNIKLVLDVRLEIKRLKRRYSEAV
ncbi:putative golgin subfamily A member 6-like protein 19 [Hydra vulgaris]|uniref:putative golgin subfamily A member 6-like protein 19 n=1 Tax=Hydra vulgaris TaxID=6087 RepID=UPI0032EA4192